MNIGKTKIIQILNKYLNFFKKNIEIRIYISKNNFDKYNELGFENLFKYIFIFIYFKNKISFITTYFSYFK